MSKVAVLVLGCWGPSVIDRIIGAFNDDRFRFFLHIDGKQDLEKYIAKMKHFDKVVLVQNRVDVYWGGFTMVEAEIELAKAALQYPDVSNLILLSDDSAPLVGADKIYQALTSFPDRITCVANGRPRHWYSDFFYTDSKFGALRGFPMDHKQFLPSDYQNIQRLEALRIKGKKSLPAMYFGRQWWALSRASLTEILKFLKSDEHFVESFRFSLFPDETFFPTAYRMCFPNNQTMNIPTYADYGRHVHPWIFTSAQEIRDTKFGEEHLFVRKLKPDMPEIIDDLAARW